MHFNMIYQLQLLSALVACSFSYRLNLDFMSTDDLQRYFSVSRAEEVPEYEIVSPTAFSGHRRRKRAIEWEEEKKEIKLEAFGEEFYMRLEENKQLLAAGLTVEKHNSDGSVEKLPLKSRRCFYHGKLLSHNTSGIAVSTCKGLTGIIALKNHNLYIRPLTDKHAEEYRRRRRDIDNPHIIYRRSVDEDMPDVDGEEAANSHFCGLDPEYRDAHIFQDAMEEKMKEMMAPSATGGTVDAMDMGTDSDETNNGSRRKRATGPKYLEVRVMADKDMMQYYGEDGVIPYTLTLMNIVAARYAEPSLGIEVIIHIVKLGILNTDYYTENGATLTVTTNGRSTLDSWSRFQYETNNLNDNHIDHWDNAVMISRKDLSLDNSNSLLGIAWLSGTCYPTLQAGLSQDAGLSTGQIIAHELGHTLGMPHDGSINCPDKVNIMASSRPVGPEAFIWSDCSQRYFNIFLASPFKTCLNDLPISTTQYPINTQDRPGSIAKFSPDEQCQQLYPGFSGSCQTDFEEICGRLYCERAFDKACYSVVPAAEGTFCGEGKWCVSGQCVSSNGQGPAPVDGAWSSWATFSQCSRTCGAGVRTRQRSCDNPSPLNGGARCEGQDTDSELCNRQDCATSQPEFAHDQCAATNDQPWGGNLHTWTAYFYGLSGDGLCSFRCLSSANFVISRGDQFADGTRCSDDGKNELLKCVDGNCVEFGCDGSLDSSQRYDKCQVCGGDGSTCTHLSGTYNGGAQYTYITFVDIPVGATSVEITNTNNRYSFLAVKPTNDDYYIFGGTDRAPSAEYPHQGVFIKYNSLSESEILYIDGPTTVELSVQIYLLYNPESSDLVRPQITYEYYSTSPMQPVDPGNPNYWVTSQGPCSASCGNGIFQEVIRCFSPTLNTPVADGQCDLSTKPPPAQQPCFITACQWKREAGPCSTTCGNGIATDNIICSSASGQVDDSQCDPLTKPTPNPTPCAGAELCPALWLPFGFQVCSATCGRGVQTRDVWCVRSNGENLVRLDDSECDQSEKPSTTQECNNPTACVTPPEQGVWVTLTSECSVSCGEGTTTAYVTCRPFQSSTEILPDSQCPHPKPPSQRQCNLGDCTVNGIWVISGFSECSVTCGRGTRTRQVDCRLSAVSQQILDDSLCPGSKPQTTQLCSLQDCITGVWVPSDFSQCSVTCGTGTRIRTVTCRPSSTSQQSLPDAQCQGLSKPHTSEFCNEQDCTSGIWVISAFSQCSASCGGGTRTRTVTCRSSTSQQSLPDSQCQGSIKPHTSEICNAQDCPSGVWVISGFSQCSVSCGGGTRTRTVTCRPSATSQQSFPDSQCEENKPHTSETCNQQDCPGPEQADYSWFVLNSYSECSVTCGSGTQSQRVWCVDRSGSSNFFQVTDSFCAGQEKPQGATRPCSAPISQCSPSGSWFTTQYSECSLSCGQGIRERGVYCHSTLDSTPLLESECDPSTKPATQLLCNNGDCPVAPDQGVVCAGVYTRTVSNVDHFSTSTAGEFCKEGIVAPMGQTIKLTFSRCNIRCNEGTDKGFVRDGSNLYNFCCYDNSFSWTSSSNVIQVEHLTVASDHGYVMTIEFLGDPTPEENGCDRVYTSPTGQVSSPNYPSSYPHGKLCNFTIVAPPGQKVILRFQVFNLHSESPWAPYFCFDQTEDNVEISDMDSTDGLRYCGEYPYPYQLRLPLLNNRILIQFRSDNDGLANEGFLVDYYFLDA